MEEKVLSPAVKGLVLALILILFSLIIFFTGQSENKSLGWIQIGIYGLAIIWSCVNYSDQMKGNVTFGNVFAHGFKTCAAASAIVLLYTFVFIKYVSPELIDKAIIQARIKWEEAKMSVSDMNKTEEWLRKYFVSLAVGSALLMYMIGGVIFSLIGTAIAKKNPDPNPFVQN